MTSKKCYQAIALALLISACSAYAQGVDRVYLGKSKTADWLSKAGVLFGSGKSYAVLVGISSYAGASQRGFASLEEAKNDVERMRKFLLDEAGFDYVQVLTEERVTKSRLDELMVDDMPGRVSKSDRFLFYWSGHGLAREAGNKTVGYLPLRDSRKDAYSTMVSMDDIARWDGLLSVKQTLFVIDACMGGLAGVQAKTDPKALAIEQFSQPSRHLLSAGTSSEEAIVGAQWRGSLFTDSLIKAASGAAVSASVTVIGLTDILAYVRRQVAFEKDRAGWSKKITPQLRQLQPSDGEFYFIRNNIPAQILIAAPSPTTATRTKSSDSAESVMTLPVAKTEAATTSTQRSVMQLFKEFKLDVDTTEKLNLFFSNSGDFLAAASAPKYETTANKYVQLNRFPLGVNSTETPKAQKIPEKVGGAWWSSIAFAPNDIDLRVLSESWGSVEEYKLANTAEPIRQLNAKARPSSNGHDSVWNIDGSELLSTVGCVGKDGWSSYAFALWNLKNGQCTALKVTLPNSASTNLIRYLTADSSINRFAYSARYGWDSVYVQARNETGAPRSIPLPSEPSRRLQVDSLRMAPGGKWLAVLGRSRSGETRDEKRIWIFNTNTGTLLAVNKGSEIANVSQIEVIDDKYIFTAGNDFTAGNELNVIDAETAKVISSQKIITTNQQKMHVASMAFHYPSRRVAVALQHWGPVGQRPAEIQVYNLALP